MEYIGISEDRLHHIISTARECYRLAKERGENEQFCRKMFLLGWLHDVGYEFSKETGEHPDVALKMITSFFEAKGLLENLSAVSLHGKVPEYPNLEWTILNIADMTIDNKGNKVDVNKRLEYIKEKHGDESYETAAKVATTIGLLKQNSLNKLSENKKEKYA